MTTKVEEVTKTEEWLSKPIEDVNGAIAPVWKSLGMQLPVPMDQHVTLCNTSRLPLTMIQYIPEGQGSRRFRPYITADGSAFNRELYLQGQGRTVVSRKIEPVQFEDMPLGTPETHRAQGRVFFKVKTKIRDKEAFRKLTDALAVALMNGHLTKDTVGDVRDMIGELTSDEYVSYSAFSLASEKFAGNKVAEHILKKGETQACRRADLRIAPPHILLGDEEPPMVDAAFNIKSDKRIKDSKDAGMSLPPAMKVPEPEAEVEIVPQEVIEAKVVPTKKKKEAKKDPEPKKVDKKALKAKLAILAASLKKVGIEGDDRMPWLKENFGIEKSSDLTIEVAEKAIELAKKPKEEKKEEEPEPEKEEAPESGMDRKKAYAKAFAIVTKIGVKDKDGFREWIKSRHEKGMSDMEDEELEAFMKKVPHEAAMFIGNQNGFSPDDFVAFAAESCDMKPEHFYEMTEEQLTSAVKQISDMMG